MAQNVARLTKFNLTAFRSYASCALPLNSASPLCVFTGPNGAGKTNLLEALSFLAPGRGLRRARLSHAQSDSCPTPWRIWAQIQGEGEVTEIGTGPETLGSERRLVKVNQVPGRATDLSSLIQVNWLTPQMDQLFLEGTSARRRFLDRLVFGFDPLHSRRVLRYEKALRERGTLLQSNPWNTSWLTAVEDILSMEGVAIAASRLEYIDKLNRSLQETAGHFPRSQIILEGKTESLLQNKPAIQVEENLKDILHAARPTDAAVGHTTQGCHKSHVQFYLEQTKGREAASCSTGEQKAILIAVILAATRLHAALDRPFFLLLDEIISHLDACRRQALFEEIIHLPVNTWMTGTDASLFKELSGKGQFFCVNNATVTAS